jgi:uncharacterized protein YjbI with pentapeptide repeats
MANPRHLKILHEGVKAWNEWRDKHPKIKPDLSEASLSELDFSNANFRLADLSWADLSYSNLNADFVAASLKFANLRGASLADADLGHTDLRGANLEQTDFIGAMFVGTNLSYLDFSSAYGLEITSHFGPSSIDIDTIYRSKGKIPESFLRDVGVPENLITYLPSLLSDPIQFYSCFISYSSKNQILADRIYADLQYRGVRCWLASEDLKIGDKIRTGIDESIRFHDKLLLILSKQSVASDWVEQEVETALDCERREKRTVLFPIRLDDTVMKIDTGWPALIKNTRNIGDFRKWRDPEAYQKAFNRLLRDLKAEESKA